MSRSFLISERLQLRAVEPEDLDVMYEMENNPETWDVSNITVPYSRFALRQYIEQSECDVYADRQLRLMVVLRTERTVIGTLDISDFAPMHSRGEVGIAIRKPYQGQGYGKEALDLLCEYVFHFLRLRQLTAHIASDNAVSIRLFESCGFVQCGMLRDWWRVGGDYKDVVVMQYLNPVHAR